MWNGRPTRNNFGSKKLTSGVVFATPEAYWNTGEASTILTKAMKMRIFAL